MGRAPCCDKANVKKGPWSPDEDIKLREFIEKYGTGGNWIALPRKAGLKRCGKSCRLRWLNYLRPNIKHGEFSDDEDRLICSIFASIGSRWSIIAAQLPGRTDNDIKNYWNTKLKKKLFGIPKQEQLTSKDPSHRLQSISNNTSNLTTNLIEPQAIHNFLNPSMGIEDLAMSAQLLLSSHQQAPLTYSSQLGLLSAMAMNNQDFGGVPYPSVFGSDHSCSSSDGSYQVGTVKNNPPSREMDMISTGYSDFMSFENCLLQQRVVMDPNRDNSFSFGNGFEGESGVWPAAVYDEIKPLTTHEFSKTVVNDAVKGNNSSPEITMYLP